LFKYALNYFVRYFCILFTLIIVLPFLGHLLIFPNIDLFFDARWIWISAGAGGALAMILTIFEIVAKRERDQLRERHPELDDEDGEENSA